MDRFETTIDNAVRSLRSLAPALAGLETETDVVTVRDRAIARGYFTPEEDDRLRAWFARYLTARAGLLELIADLRPVALGEKADVDEATRIRSFALGYTAACLLVQAGRHLVFELATHGIVQRKLNEAEPRFRIPRKQYTAVYRSLTRPRHAWRLAQARRFADQHRRELEALRADPRIGGVLRRLARAEAALDVTLERYLTARARYRWHSWRRRHASAAQKGLFAVFEASGRIVADLRPWWRRNRVTPKVQRRLAALLEPGDVIITRHQDALSNLFLPGFWPHASLHVGPAAVKVRLPVAPDDPHAARWVEPLRVLEARKDGVRFRPLDDTLAVDAVAIIRPRLAPADIDAALARAIAHEGKLYNFDFDFFCADRLVCTEVVYRAYDGVGGLDIPLKIRSGRPTLSAEDLLDLARQSRGFEPVAVFGAPGTRWRIATGEAARRAIARTT